MLTEMDDLKAFIPRVNLPPPYPPPYTPPPRPPRPPRLPRPPRPPPPRTPPSFILIYYIGSREKI